MQKQNTTLSVRTDKNLKTEVGIILEKMGLNHSTAINIFYHMIHAYSGLPFDLKLPSPETIKAMKESEQGKNVKSFNSTEELFKDLEI